MEKSKSCSNCSAAKFSELGDCFCQLQEEPVDSEDPCDPFRMIGLLFEKVSRLKKEGYALEERVDGLGENANRLDEDVYDLKGKVNRLEEDERNLEGEVCDLGKDVENLQDGRGDK